MCARFVDIYARICLKKRSNFLCLIVQQGNVEKTLVFDTSLSFAIQVPNPQSVYQTAFHKFEDHSKVKWAREPKVSGFLDTFGLFAFFGAAMDLFWGGGFITLQCVPEANL